MKTDTLKFALRFIAIAVATSALGGCAFFSSTHVAATSNERECLARVMYFESNRSSDDGMLAVGTVVMNRKESGKYPSSICGVVGQNVQFAPGALSKPMSDAGRPRAFRVADQVLSGKRYPGMKGVYFFHTAGYTYPYRNMHYVAVAGGNAFYEKRQLPGGKMPSAPVMVAQADPMPSPTPTPVMSDAMPSPEPRKHTRSQPQIAEYRPAVDAQADPVDTLPPVRPRAAGSKRQQTIQPQFAQNDALPDALPPVRPRAAPAKRNAEPQFAQNDDAMPDALPPVRPRASVGQARPLPSAKVRTAQQQQTPQFQFNQGPSGSPQPQIRQRPRVVLASQSQPQSASRAVPTVRIQPVAVEADMGGAPAPAPMKRSPKAAHSSLEPDPLF